MRGKVDSKNTSWIDLAIENVCMLEQSKGNGQLNLQRWAFDQNSKKCISFAYSGSGGNQNNFLTREDCLKRCPGKTFPFLITFCYFTSLTVFQNFKIHVLTVNPPLVQEIGLWHVVLALAAVQDIGVTWALSWRQPFAV